MDPNDTNNPPPDDVMGALDAGIAAATEAPAASSPPADTAAQPAAAAPAAAAADPAAAGAAAADPVPGSEEARAAAEAAAAAAAGAAGVAPGDPAAAARTGEAAETETDKAVEDEIVALGLKEKSAVRFRELSAEVKALAPIRDQLTKAGVTDLAQLPAVLERSQAADKMIGMVMETGASAEQYGKSLDYLALVNRAIAGDRTAGEQAFKAIGEEYASLARALGKPVPGVYDPLSDYPDLQAEVEAEDLTVERAHEIAAQRNSERARQQHQQSTEQGQAEVRAVEDGRQALMQFDQAMRASDPTYMARREALSAQVAEIRKNHPPAQWVAQAALALAKIPVPAAAPAPAVAAANPAPKPPVGPMRPGAARPALVAVPDDPMEALNLGISEASGGSA